MTDRLLTNKEININWDIVIGYPCQQTQITKSELESLLKAQAKLSRVEAFKELVPWFEKHWPIRDIGDAAYLGTVIESLKRGEPPKES